MKTKLKSILAIALCAVGLAAFAEPQTIDGSGVTWELTDGNTVLTIGGSGAMPDFKEDAAAPWYSERATITTVEIGSGVTRIGSSAFRGCQKMASVTIPSSVTSIGGGAFVACAGVAELRIDSIESWCKVSIDVGIGTDGPFVESTVSEKKLYVGGADVPTTALVIPDGIKTVNNYAFAHFDMLTSVTIPSSVTSIRLRAFDSCSGLTSVTISEGVTNIGDSAFTGCTGLTSVTIPSSVTSIGYNAFYFCTELTSVTISEGVPSIAYGMFLECYNLTSVTIPASVTNIGETAFKACHGLTRVTIPSSVENIGQQAFNDCTGLTSVTIPSSVENIGNGAFGSCSALKYVVEMREQPPTAGTNIFGHWKAFKGTIYVSPTSVDTYKATGGWNTYEASIKSWLPTVEYLDWDDEKKEMCSVTCMAYDVVTADTATFEAGRTYVVTNDVINASDPLGITVEGTAANPTRLILCDGTKLTVTGQSAAETAGLNVSNGTAIVICGQKDGTGELVATGGSAAAGIGGNANQAAGTVTIYGGSVTALGKDGGAGIGGGMNKTDTGTVTFGAKFNVLAGNDAGSAQPIPQDDYANDHSAAYVHIEPMVVAQFVKGGKVVVEFATADEAVAALDDAQYADIEEFRIGLASDTVFDFGGRTNRVVILNVGDVENTLKNVLLDCAGDYVVTGLVGTVVFGDGVRIEKDTGFMGGLVTLIIKGGLYKSDPSWYCEDGYSGARRCDANAALNGLYAILPEAEIAVTVSKGLVPTHYATLQDAFNLIGEYEDVTLRLFNNLELGTAVTKLEGNKVIHLLPSESGANTITRVGPEPVIEIGREAKLEISNVVFDGANVTSEKPMIEVAGKTGTKFGWLIAGDGFVVSNAVGGAVHVGSGGKFELNGVAKIIENTTGGKPKNVIIEDKQAIVLVNGGAVTDGNYAQIGVWSETAKFMIPGGQFGTVDTSYEYATDFADGDISVAKPWVGFINDLDGSLHHAAGAKTAAAGKKNYKRWVGGEYKELVEEGDHLISREKSIVSVSPELIWTARQEAPAAQPAPAVLDWTDTTLTLAVSNGCDYALVTSGSAETNWVSMVGTDNTYAFARPAGTDYLCLRRYSITPSNIVSAATAYSVRVAAGTVDDPWTVGAENPEGVTAWTNGTEFVVGGTGTVSDLSKLASKVTVEKLTIKDATVTGAESEAFKGFNDVSLSLPDGWQGELPGEGGNWYGALIDMENFVVPLAVKNVAFQQRYPWNGKVDIGFGVTGSEGEKNVIVTVCTNGTKIADFTAAVTIPASGVLATNLVWDAAAAGLAANFKSDDVTVEVKIDESDIAAKSEAGALDLTVGDRVAKDTETLVVDPAWDETDPTSAKVRIDGEDEPRTYTCASNDLWQTASLEPGRYEAELMTACSSCVAGFWKVGDDWTVFDSSNITADVTFEAGKTYLFFGTNTADGVTLKVEDGAKFAYDKGAPAGFLGGTVNLPTRYEQKTVEGEFYQIVEKIKGCEGNPWVVGEGVTAYTNGSELVIGGAGTVGALSGVDGLKDLLAGLTAINVTSNGVTGAEAQAFADVGIDGGSVLLSLPDGWQGEFPDEDGNWYGATGVTLTAVPLTVKKVTFLQRYPWNGKVDVGFTLTGPAGETNVVVTVCTNGTKIADFTAAVTIPADGVLATNLVWDAATAGLAANFKSDDVTVEVKIAASDIAAKSAAGALDLTVGDRVAKDFETLVVDPAWGEASEATVAIDGEASARTYTCASNDMWQTEALTPGRYTLALSAGATNETAAFWKIDRATWEVLDLPPYSTEGIEFQSNKTYLVLGQYEFAPDKPLTVVDGAKFEYGAGAGFKGGAAEMPRRYRQEAVEGDLYRIVEAIKGCADNPWEVGDGVEAYTNGTELVIGGAGTVGALSGVDGLKDLLAGLTAINVTSNGVTGAEAQAFADVGTADDPVSLTLPDGWQGELPDKDGNWYGANAVLTRIPLAVKKVKFAQRYPWNGLVNVGFTLTGPEGETNVVITVRDGEAAVTNFTAAVTIPADGTLETSLVWDAATAGLAANFKSDDVTVEVKIDESDIAAKSAAGTVDLRTAVALAEGETTVSNVTWSATLWGELDEEFVTAIGWTNLTTGATGVFSNLAGVVGEAAEDADLPQKDGEYVLTHSTGNLKSFVTFVVSGFPAGSGPDNPWYVGTPDPQDAAAWVDNALTNVAPIVADVGLPDATNAIDLVALTNGMARWYAPILPLDAILLTGNGTGVLPAKWINQNGETFRTLAEALAAGSTTVTPVFETDDGKVDPPKTIVEEIEVEVKPGETKTVTATMKNNISGAVTDPIQSVGAEGLAELAASSKSNVVLDVTAKGTVPTAQDLNAAAVAAMDGRTTASKTSHYAEITLTAIAEDGTETPLPGLPEPLAIRIPWTFEAHHDYKVVRHHEGATGTTTKVFPETADADGEWVEFDKANGLITVHSAFFSDYAIVDFALATVRVKVPAAASLPAGVQSITVKVNGSTVPQPAPEGNVSTYEIPVGATVEVVATAKSGYGFKSEGGKSTKTLVPSGTVPGYDITVTAADLEAVPMSVQGNSALLPLPYEFKASVKHMYLKEVKVKVNGFNGTVYQKYAKASSLKGYMVIDRWGSTSQTIVTSDTKNYNNVPGTGADYGANRAFVIVRNSSVEASVRKPKVLPAVIDAKWLDTSFTKAHRAASGLAEGYLFIGGDSIACVRPQLDEVGGAVVERAAAPQPPAAGTPGMTAYADYLWTSVYLFGLRNGPNWYFDGAKGPFDAFETAWDANLPAGLQTAFAVGRPHFHDTWMNGSGVGRYFVPNATADGDLCCGLQPTTMTYEPVISSLSGNLKGGLFLCSENGINAMDPAYATFDGNSWEEQFATARLLPAGSFVPDNWQTDLWQDGSVEQETTDVLYGTWSIKYCKTFFKNVYRAVEPKEMEALVKGAPNAKTGTVANHVEAAAGLYNLVGAIKGSVLKLDRNAKFIEMADPDKEIHTMTEATRLDVPAITPKFAQYFGLANWW